MEADPDRLRRRLGDHAFRTAARAISDTDPVDPLAVVSHAARVFLAPELAPILAAADRTARPDPGDVPESVLDVVALYRPPYRPVPFTRGSRTVWGLATDTILERAAAEIIELYVARPRLRRCIFCNAAFVPTANEANCNWNLWRRPATSGQPAVQRCVDAAVIDDYMASQERKHEQRATDPAVIHEREKKRLNIAYRRELRKQDGNTSHPLVVHFKKAYDDYMASPTRWRRERGQDPVIVSAELPAE